MGAAVLVGVAFAVGLGLGVAVALVGAGLAFAVGGASVGSAAGPVAVGDGRARRAGEAAGFAVAPGLASGLESCLRVAGPGEGLPVRCPEGTTGSDGGGIGGSADADADAAGPGASVAAVSLPAARTETQDGTRKAAATRAGTPIPAAVQVSTVRR
ncbi:hypothetical protein GSF24_36225, partial [Microbispora triticiradicis]|nr:hypothetical protein [Microbispora triticiradicis]